VSWRACAHWVGRYVSFIHFLPRPGPGTRRSPSAGVPVTGNRAFRHMLGAIRVPALVGAREAYPVSTVYRSPTASDDTGSAVLPPPDAPLDQRRRCRRPRSTPYPASRTAGSAISAHPQLWKVLWTGRAVQGRRPM
jgi:hypothetical protein